MIDRGWFGAQQLSSHGLFDITVEAHGDTHIDDHHTNEDIALALGTVWYLLLQHPFAGDSGCTRDELQTINSSLLAMVYLLGILVRFNLAPIS